MAGAALGSAARTTTRAAWPPLGLWPSCSCSASCRAAASSTLGSSSAAAGVQAGVQHKAVSATRCPAVEAPPEGQTAPLRRQWQLSEVGELNGQPMAASSTSSGGGGGRERWQGQRRGRRACGPAHGLRLRQALAHGGLLCEPRLAVGLRRLLLGGEGRRHVPVAACSAGPVDGARRQASAQASGASSDSRAPQAAPRHARSPAWRRQSRRVARGRRARAPRRSPWPRRPRG